MSGNVALLFRIKLQVPFGSVKAHGTENFFSTGSYSLMTATQEDELFLKWIKGANLTGAIFAKYSKYLQKQSEYKPIPGSARDLKRDEYDAHGNRKSKYAIVRAIRKIFS